MLITPSAPVCAYTHNTPQPRNTHGHVLQEHLDPEHDPVEGMLGMVGSFCVWGKKGREMGWLRVLSSGAAVGRPPASTSIVDCWRSRTPPFGASRSCWNSLMLTLIFPPVASGCIAPARAWQRHRRQDWWTCLLLCSMRRGCWASGPPPLAQVGVCCLRVWGGRGEMECFQSLAATPCSLNHV